VNNGRAKIDKSLKGFSISIPSKKNWFVLLFGTAWIGGWYFGFSKTMELILSNDFNNNESGNFFLFWLFGWTVVGIGFSILLLWGFFGKEHFRTKGNHVHFEKTVFGIGKKRKLKSSELKNFRTDTVNDSWFGGNSWSHWGLGEGKIKFDYGLKTYSFGLGVDDAEAVHIVDLLQKQFESNELTQVTTP